MRVACAPEQRAPRLTKRVERPNQREIAEWLFLQTHTRCELVKPAIRAVHLALRDDGRGLVVAEPFHFVEPDTDIVNPAGALRSDRLRAVGHVPLDAGWALLDDSLRG